MPRSPLPPVLCCRKASDLRKAQRRLAAFSERFAKTASKAAACLAAAFDDALAAMAWPEKYRRRLRSTNLQERLNEAIRRRERVIRIFPNDESARRLIGTLLAGQNEVWQERKYLDRDELHEWLATRREGAQHARRAPHRGTSRSPDSGADRRLSSKSRRLC